jgi:TRAP-type C4-dicarboxylate transport system substrate-binding protein
MITIQAVNESQRREVKTNWHVGFAIFITVFLVLFMWQNVFATVKWDLVMYVGITHPQGQLLKEFADEVKKQTHGALEIVVRPAGELPYKLNEFVRVVGQGQVQLSDGYAGFISGDVKIASLPSIPFLIRTVDDLIKSMDVLEPYVVKDLEKFGVSILFWYTYPPQNVWGRGNPITTIDSFKGRKIRANSPEVAEMLKRFGAVPVAFGPEEIPAAVQRGILDGAVTAGFNVLGSKWYEFLNWGFVPDLNIGGPSYILMNKKAFESLPFEVRSTLQTVANQFSKRMLREIPIREEQDRKILETTHKMQIIRPPVSEIQKGQKIMESYWTEWAKGEAEIEALQKVRRILGK